MEEARRNGVETYKNKDKSSNYDVYLHVMTYVVSDRLFWNSICVVQFVSHNI